MRRCLTTLLCLIPAGLLHSQGTGANHPQKELFAHRIDEPMRIDGFLTEAVWSLPGATDFTQLDPIEGAKPSQRTEITIGYDDRALYIGASMYDTAPDSIVARLSRRDDYVRSDLLRIGIDAWLDHRTGFYFFVNAAGGISDGTLLNDDSGDDAWDGVWESAVSINDEGWFAEIRIPYSQLRFPDKDEHIWGINFARVIERHNEEDLYVLVPKAASGMVSWFAHLNGIKGISRPSYVEVLPYSAGKIALTHPETGDPFNDGSTLSGQAGIDVKIGLTSTLTLDATLNPDFGQVEVDPAVVNLSDFETFFP